VIKDEIKGIVEGHRRDDMPSWSVLEKKLMRIRNEPGDWLDKLSIAERLGLMVASFRVSAGSVGAQHIFAGFVSYLLDENTPVKQGYEVLNRVFDSFGESERLDIVAAGFKAHHEQMKRSVFKAILGAREEKSIEGYLEALLDNQLPTDENWTKLVESFVQVVRLPAFFETVKNISVSGGDSAGAIFALSAYLGMHDSNIWFKEMDEPARSRLIERGRLLGKEVGIERIFTPSGKPQKTQLELGVSDLVAASLSRNTALKS